MLKAKKSQSEILYVEKLSLRKNGKIEHHQREKKVYGIYQYEIYTMDSLWKMQNNKGRNFVQSDMKEQLKSDS